MAQPLPIEEVRKLATWNGYREVQHNETSRVVAFVDAGKTARVNVYYTTGTVATCLNHPRSGKTQLFRRHRTLAELGEIFANVRAHTGAGYFRRHGGNLAWARSSSSAGPPPGHGGSRETECDDARRWRYVHISTGFCNDAQANQIAALCRIWDSLRFQPGQTSKEYVESFSEEKKNELERLFGPNDFCCDANDPNCRCRCAERAGAWCNLYRIIVTVARDLEQVRIVHSPKETARQDVDEEILDYMEFRLADEASSCPCHEGNEFQEAHSALLSKLERQLRSFPTCIRKELLVWFFDKLTHGTSNLALLFDVGDDEYARYLQEFCSKEILQCHRDYGETFYPEGQKGCNCHGV